MSCAPVAISWSLPWHAAPGLRCDALDDAFYAFVDCSGAIGAATPSGDVIATDLDFANDLLEAAHVGVVQGSAFGVENHVRIAYAVPMPTPRDACRRIETACAALTTAVAAI